MSHVRTEAFLAYDERAIAIPRGRFPEQLVRSQIRGHAHSSVRESVQGISMLVEAVCDRERALKRSDIEFDPLCSKYHVHPFQYLTTGMTMVAASLFEDLTEIRIPNGLSRRSSDLTSHAGNPRRFDESTGGAVLPASPGAPTPSAFLQNPQFTKRRIRRVGVGPGRQPTRTQPCPEGPVSVQPRLADASGCEPAGASATSSDLSQRAVGTDRQHVQRVGGDVLGVRRLLGDDVQEAFEESRAN